MSEFMSEQSAADCVMDNMAEFAGYTIESKLPSAVDGLKVIHRRILWQAHKTPARQKEASLTGLVMKMHPHGDAAISETISNMAQPFTHMIPLIFSESNVGTYVGDPPAAARYVDCGESEVAKDLFFGDLNPAMLKIVPSESGDATEPAYLIPRLPTSLLVPSFGIAIGYQTNTPACNPKDLCKLTKEYIRLRMTEVDWKSKAPKLLAKYMVPDFPVVGLLRNSDLLIDEYKKRNFAVPMVVDGVMHVKSDCITISTLPPGVAFDTTTYKLGYAMAKDKNSWEYQNFQQMEDFAGEAQSNMRGQFDCVLRRGVNPFDVLATLKKRLSFSSNWNPNRNYVDEESRLVAETPLSLLDRWYRVRYAATLGDLKQHSNNLVDRYRQLLALIIVCDYPDDVFNIFKTSKTEEETVPKLCKKFESRGLSMYQARFLAGLKFSQVTAKGRDELNADMEKVKQQMKDLQTQFHRINELMIESIDRFEQKWIDGPVKMTGSKKIRDFTTRRCAIPKYIGTACYKGTGWIMLENEDEMDTILKDFDPEFIDFEFFNNRNQPYAIGAEETIRPGEDLPKYLKAGLVTQAKYDKYTACQCIKAGAMVLEGRVPIQPHMSQAIPIGNAFGYITKSGTWEVQNVTNKVIRRDRAANGAIKESHYVSDITDDEVIVIHGSSSQTNQLNIERINKSGKLRRIALGQWFILKVMPVSNDRVIVNIPKELRQRCVVRHIVLDHLADHLKTNSRITLSFGRGVTGEMEVVNWKRRSTIQVGKFR